jgi:nitroreductase
MTKFQTRQSDYPIDELFISRVSWRAFSNEQISNEELMSLFEAARWSPSSYNSQPWRFVYARKGENAFNQIFDCLIDFNQSWCKNADILIVTVTKLNFEHNNKPSSTASFDCGAAWMSLALEANKKGIVTHAMAGFDHEKLAEVFKIPHSFKIEAVIAVGKKGSIEILSNDLKEREKPSERKSLDEFISNGTFNFI